MRTERCPGGSIVVGMLVAAVALLGAAGCGEDDEHNEGGITITEAGGSCDPSSCIGCCMAGTCMAGNTINACGAAGLPCVQCQSGEACLQGQCVKSTGKCSASTCPSGCCLGDTCTAGNTATACGKGGAACASCAAGQKCDSQSCTCGTSGCSGCCDNGACRSGMDVTACGTGGGACVKCSTGESCVAGACATSGTCSSTSCASGCCAGSVCKSGKDLAACGQNGGTCKQCSTSETCSQGSCVNTSQCNSSNCTGCCSGTQCLSGTSASACGSGGTGCKTCGTNQTCESNACKLDPSSKWGIVVYSAEIDTSKTWDTLVYTAPDPYATLSVGGQTQSTTPKSDTYTPTWDEYMFTVSASSLSATGMVIGIYDDDTWPASDQLIGGCKVTVSDSVLLAGSGYVTNCGSTGDVKKVTFKFQAK